MRKKRVFYYVFLLHSGPPPLIYEKCIENSWHFKCADKFLLFCSPSKHAK